MIPTLLLCLVVTVFGKLSTVKMQSLLVHQGPIIRTAPSESDRLQQSIKSCYASIPFQSVLPLPRASDIVAVRESFKRVLPDAEEDVVDLEAANYLEDLLTIAEQRIGTTEQMTLPENDPRDFVLEKIKEDMKSNPTDYYLVYRNYPEHTNTLLPFQEYAAGSGISTVQMLFRVFYDISNWSFLFRNFAPAVEQMQLVSDLPEPVKLLFSRFSLRLREMLIFMLDNDEFIANTLDHDALMAIMQVFTRIEKVFSKIAFSCEHVTYIAKDYISLVDSDTHGVLQKNGIESFSAQYFALRSFCQSVISEGLFLLLPIQQREERNGNSLKIMDVLFDFPETEEYDEFFDKVDAFAFAFRSVLDFLNSELFLDLSRTGLSISTVSSQLERIILFAPVIGKLLSENNVVFNILSELSDISKVKRMFLDATLFSGNRKDFDIINAVTKNLNQPMASDYSRDVSILFKNLPSPASIWHRLMFFPYIRSSVSFSSLPGIHHDLSYVRLRQLLMSSMQRQIKLLSYLQIDNFKKLKQSMPIFYSLYDQTVSGTLRDYNRDEIPLYAIQEFVSSGAENANSMKQFMELLSSAAFKRELIGVLGEIVLVGKVYPVPTWDDSIGGSIHHHASFIAKRSNVWLEETYTYNEPLAASFPKALEAVKTLSNVWQHPFFRIIQHLDMLLWLIEAKV